MSNVKVCPHCGGQQFMAFIKRGGLVECDGMDENNKPTFKVIKEGAKGKFELEIIRCATCQANVTEADLIGGVPCKTCGKLVNPSSLDENGNCEVCSMLVNNPQLKNASQDELLRLLAKAMKGVKSDTTLVQQKEVQAAEVEESLGINQEGEPKVAEPLSAADAILNGETPPDAQAKPKRKRAVRRANDASVETPSETPIIQGEGDISSGEQQSATEQIAQSQEAPFPDIEGMPSVPPAPPEPPAELPNPAGGGFQMFDNNEDDEPF